MRTSNALKPATADTVNGPRDDRLGGAIEETNSSLFDGAQADLAGSTEAGFFDFEPLGNQGLSEPEIDLAPKARHLRFERVNEVTWKLTDGRLTITPTPPGRHWSGHKTTRAVAWIMGIGYGLWIARYRNKASRPMKLPAAKKYALEMIKDIRPGIVLDDPIGHLNWVSVIEPPSAGQITDIMGGQHRGRLDREFRARIVEIESGSALVMPAAEIADAPLSGEDYPLEYFEGLTPKQRAIDRVYRKVRAYYA